MTDREISPAAGATEKQKRAPGAGRKPLPDADRKHRRTVRLSDDEWAWCESQGNASEYIRRLIERDRKSHNG